MPFKDPFLESFICSTAIPFMSDVFLLKRIKYIRYTQHKGAVEGSDGDKTMLFGQ